ncbi:MAG: helix-turn-helix domain-containing protein [Defluviitaleaceae bacterium]|nr:helix-turn-helix domain-containing protein [Defluviitaleaceae bacterium]
MEIYERIKHLRKSVLNMTREKFGSALGANGNVINNIERGRLANPEQKEPLYRLICKTFNVNYEWLTAGNGEMFFITEADAKAEAMRLLSEAYNLDKADQVWLSVFLDIPPEERKPLKALALRLAEAAAELSNDMEAAEELVADAQSAHDEHIREWNKGLTLEEELELVRRRHENAKRGAVASTTSAKVGSDAIPKVSVN